MMMRTVATVVAGVALMAPAVAQAGFEDEMQAGSAVERKLDRRWPTYSFYAFCDQYGSRKYWCTFNGTKGTCLKSGHARVSKLTYGGYRVRLRGINTDCY